MIVQEKNRNSIKVEKESLLMNQLSYLSNNRKKQKSRWEPSLCADCKYFFECSWLQLQTVTSACVWVMTPSLSHCLNIGRVSAVIINEQENM